MGRGFSCELLLEFGVRGSSALFIWDPMTRRVEEKVRGRRGIIDICWEIPKRINNKKTESYGWRTSDGHFDADTQGEEREPANLNADLQEVNAITKQEDTMRATTASLHMKYKWRTTHGSKIATYTPPIKNGWKPGRMISFLSMAPKGSFQKCWADWKPPGDKHKQERQQAHQGKRECVRSWGRINLISCQCRLKAWCFSHQVRTQTALWTRRCPRYARLQEKSQAQVQVSAILRILHICMQSYDKFNSGIFQSAAHAWEGLQWAGASTHHGWIGNKLATGCASPRGENWGCFTRYSNNWFSLICWCFLPFSS